mgnify:CR=1 FL=1
MKATLHPTTSVSLFPEDGDTPFRVHALVESDGISNGEPVSIRLDREEVERLIYALQNAIARF